MSDSKTNNATSGPTEKKAQDSASPTSKPSSHKDTKGESSATQDTNPTSASKSLQDNNDTGSAKRTASESDSQDELSSKRQKQDTSVQFGEKPSISSTTNPWAAASMLAQNSGGFGSFGSGKSSSFGAGGSMFGTAASSSQSKGFGGTASGFGSFGGAFKAGESTLFSVASGDKTAAQKVTEKASKEVQELMKKHQQVDTGEEEEKKLSQATVKLYVFVMSGGQGKWSERGKGMLTVNESRANGNDVRLVMRQESSKRLCLNAPIWSGCNIGRASEKAFRVSLVNHANSSESKGVEVYMIKTGQAAESEKLYGIIEDKVKAIQSADSQADSTASGDKDGSTNATVEGGNGQHEHDSDNKDDKGGDKGSSQ